MPKHVADALEAAILADLPAELARHRRALRIAMRPHIEQIVAENGRLRMALAHAVNPDPESR